MNDFIEDFLAGLEADKPKPTDYGDRITKVLMSALDNQGTVMFAPVMNEHKKFYTSLQGVREFNMICSLIQEGKTPVWVKILPKEAYGELTAEESRLYDEVTGLFDQVNEKYEDMDAKQKYGFIRWRSYSLFQGKLLKHTNRANEPLSDNVGKAVLLIFPSLSPISGMADAIQTKSNALGNKSWIAPIFATPGALRQGAMTISFTKPDKPGYDCSVAFEFNSSFSKVVDDTTPIEESIETLCQSTMQSWLTWQCGDNKLFNTTLFNEIKNTLTAELNKVSAGAPAPAPTPVVNQNGVDPMIGSAPAPQPVVQPAAPVVNGVDTTKLPF